MDMKRALVLLVVLCMGAAAVKPRPRVLLVSIDGLWARDLQRAESAGVRLPVLDSLRRAGALAAGVVGSFPSVTYPSHTTIITGVPPARHGIYSNRRTPLPTDTSALEVWYWEAASIRVPTLFDAAHAAGLKTAAVGWPVTADNPSITYDLPEVWDPRAFGDSDLAVMRGRGTPGVLDSLGAPPTGPLSDSLRADFAAAIIRRWDPDFLALHLNDVDHWKHEQGVWGDSVVVALRAVDRELGRVLAAVGATAANRRTTVVITSDHGFFTYRERIRPGVLLARAGLVTLDSAGRATAWDAAVVVNGGSVMIVPRDSTDPSVSARIRAAIPDSLVGPGKPFRAVWPRDTLTALGSDPRALWALDVAEGFYAVTGYRGALTGTRATPGGGHGFDPRQASLYAFFMISGPGVKQGSTRPLMRQVDIAAVVARALGLRGF